LFDRSSYDLGAVLEERSEVVEELLLLIDGEYLLVFETRWVVILSSPQVDVT